MPHFETLSFQPAPGSQNFADFLTLHQMAQEFRLEQEYRQAFADHCHWYARVACEHQADLAAMAQEPDVLGWFRRDGHGRSRR